MHACKVGIKCLEQWTEYDQGTYMYVFLAFIKNNYNTAGNL